MCNEANLIFLIKPRFVSMLFELLLVSILFLINIEKIHDYL